MCTPPAQHPQQDVQVICVHHTVGVQIRNRLRDQRRRRPLGHVPINSRSQLALGPDADHFTTREVKQLPSVRVAQSRIARICTNKHRRLDIRQPRRLGISEPDAEYLRRQTSPPPQQRSIHARMQRDHSDVSPPQGRIGRRNHHVPHPVAIDVRDVKQRPADQVVRPGAENLVAQRAGTALTRQHASVDRLGRAHPQVALIHHAARVAGRYIWSPRRGALGVARSRS